MIGTVRQLVVPAYLFLCLLLGGSAQAIWGNMILQLVGLAIIAWALGARSAEPLTGASRHMVWIAVAALAIVAIQLVPLPASLWANTGGRQGIADGYRILGLAAPVRPLSLDPYATIDTLLGVIPPIAIFLGVVRLKAYRAIFATGALIAGTLAGILLSALQVSSGATEQSPWYLYAVTNFGNGVGFFANANHMASLLVITLPFLAALVPAARRSKIHRYSALVTIAAALAVLILIGLGLNRSLAAVVLTLPVGLASVAIFLRSGRRSTRLIAIGAAVLLAVGVGAIAVTEIGKEQIGADATGSVTSRTAILGPTLEITRDYLPFGTGLGTFVNVYPMYEEPSEVAATYVIHAHNDFAEWVMETGLPGLVVLVLFLVWWARSALGVWSSPEAGAFARAAAIASAALLAHSLVDFPLRTGALSACFGLCIALLADRRQPQASHADDLRPTRHLVYR